MRYLVFAGILGSVPALAAPPVVVEQGVLWIEGQSVPGAGDAFQSFDRPIRVGGVTAMTAESDGSTLSDDVLIVGSTLIARENDAAPGIPGAQLGTFVPMITGHEISTSGSVIYITSLRNGPSGADQAIFVDQSLVGRVGQSVASIEGRLAEAFSFPGLDDSHRACFHALLDGATTDDSIIVRDGIVLYREGASVPAIPGTPGIARTTWDANFDEVSWNGAGSVIFEGNTSLPTASDVVVFLRIESGDGAFSESVVAQEGEPILTYTGVDALDTVLQTALADDGSWLARGRLRAAPAEFDDVVLTARGVLVQQGDAIPSLPGALVGDIFGAAIGAADLVVIQAAITGHAVHDEGIFVGAHLVLATGMSFPGIPAGSVITDFGAEGVSIGAEGEIVAEVAFGGAVAGDAVIRILLAPTCAEDVSGDGEVGLEDVTALLADFGPCPQSGACAADLNGDGQVGFPDLLKVLTAWGDCGG